MSLLTALAVLLAWGPGSQGLLFAADGETPAAVKYASHLEMKPGPLNGQVLYTDGKTPAAKVPVRVWSVKEKKFVYETTTDDEGNYKIPELAEGKYLAVFGDRVIVDLRVSDAALPVKKPFNVIIPEGKPLLTREELVAELSGEKEGVPRILRTVIIIGAATVTAVGVVALAGGFKGEERRRIVSP